MLLQTHFTRGYGGNVLHHYQAVAVTYPVSAASSARLQILYNHNTKYLCNV